MFNEVNIHPNDVIRLNFNNAFYIDLDKVLELREFYQTVFPNNIVIADLDTNISSIDIFHMNQGDSLLSLDKDRIF